MERTYLTNVQICGASPYTCTLNKYDSHVVRYRFGGSDA
jgi:hypothetical protein